MSDLISRQAAIDAVAEGLKRTFVEYRDVAEKMLNKVPSAQPEQRWIPCSERLPESYTDVLVWFEYYRYGDYNRLYQMHGIGTYIKEYDSWIINHETGWRKLRVFAWMPLPEPWEGEEHGASRTMLPKKSLC